MSGKITLGMIARDAGQTLRQCLNSVAPFVDEIIIGFGGPSKDDTVEIADEFLRQWRSETGGVSHTFNIDWRDDFAYARNEVMARATSEYFFWLDADDELINGAWLRAYVDKNPEANAFFLPYHYSEDAYGNLNCVLVRERLVRQPSLWSWEGAIHEVLTLDPNTPLTPVFIEDIVIKHQPDRPKERGTRNLEILYRELARTEPDPPQRVLLYLGQENYSRGNWNEALMHWRRFISRAQVNDEAYLVAVHIGDLLRDQGNLREAEQAYHNAIKLAPSWPLAFFGLAETAYARKAWQETIEWISAGSTKAPPRTGLIINPRDFDYRPTYFLGLAYAQLGDIDTALENLHKAAAIIPDKDLVTTITALEREKGSNRVLDAFMTVYEHLGRNDEWLKARKLFALAPKAIEQHPTVMEAWWKTSQSTAHVDDPQIMVDFYTGNPAWAPMDEATIFSDGWRDHPRMKFAINGMCPPPTPILDIGSSDGFMSLVLAKDGHWVEGWDLDPRCVDLANERAKRLGLTAEYHVGSVDDVEGHFDAALAFEILEHLVDPGAFLDRLDQLAGKVLITTPYLAWEGGRLPDWEKVEPKSHLRIFDLSDMERLLTGRGRIVDLYREPWGTTGWIFAKYRPGMAVGRGITILAPGTLEQWSPRKLQDEGLGGSETALIRLAEELSYQDDAPLVTVYGRIDSPGYYSRVRYRQAENFNADISQSAFIAWRYPEAADLPLKGKLILWMHDTDAGDRLTPVRAARFDKIVVLTEWHKANMQRIYPFIDEDKFEVIGNGVDKERFMAVRGNGKAPKREPLRVVYTSSPDRGLDAILESIWPEVIEQVPEAELHVYYGWKAWESGVLTPEQMAYKQRVGNLLAISKNVIMHGRVNPATMAEELLKASIWLYPSKMPNMAPWHGMEWHETYCIAAAEAQVAGLIPITTNTAALAETVASGIIIEGLVTEPAVAHQYVEAVVKALQAEPKELNKLRAKIKAAAPSMSWSEVAERWSEVLAAV